MKPEVVAVYLEQIRAGGTPNVDHSNFEAVMDALTLAERNAYRVRRGWPTEPR